MIAEEAVRLLRRGHLTDTDREEIAAWIENSFLWAKQEPKLIISNDDEDCGARGAD